MKPLLPLLACLAFAACAAPPAPETAADTSACTAAADAQYQQDTVDQEARPVQNGQRYGAMPTQVFEAERLGALNQRDTTLRHCEETGNDGAPMVNGVPVVTPHIIAN